MYQDSFVTSLSLEQLHLVTQDSPLYLRVAKLYIIDDKKVQAIMLFKAETGIDLKDSKEYVESIGIALANTIPRSLKEIIISYNQKMALMKGN